MVGIPAFLLYYPYHGGYTSLPTIHTLYRPGYTTVHHCRLVYRSSCPVCSTRPADGVLGSNPRIVREYEAKRALVPPKV